MHASTHPPAARPLRLPRLRGAELRARAALVVTGAAVVALALAAAMPRGPVTSGEALAAMASAVALGLAGGAVLRSRWAMLLLPVVFAAAFELRWLTVDGPTVDGIRLGGTYEMLALLLGRGFLGLLVFPPLLVGVALGAAFARRGERRGGSGWTQVRRAVTAAALVAVVALAALVARPGTTPPILGSDGEPLAGSIASLEQVELGGGTQWIQIRGHDVDAPVLLYLHGGPGQSGLPFTRFLLGDLERDFVVVDWDQRGNGKSHGALEPRSTYTLDGIVDDTIELSRYLARRFGERKIYLAGTSWGSTLGVLAAQRAPDAFHAFVGGGQMVSQRETDVRIYRDLLAYGSRTDDTELVVRLRELGEPPYEDVFAYAWVMQRYELIEPDYELLPAIERIGEEHGREIGPWGVLGREYDVVEKVNVLRGLMETFAALYPQLQTLDFRSDVPTLDVPVYLFRGTSELAGRDDLAVEWFAALDAPRKRMYTLDHAGHAVLQERADRLREILVGTILPETYDAERAWTQTKGETR